jgi:hypothetical protein
MDAVHVEPDSRSRELTRVLPSYGFLAMVQKGALGQGRDVEEPVLP